MFVYVHGVVFPVALVCWSHPLRRSKGWGRDNMVSELKVATMGLYGPRRCSDKRWNHLLYSAEQRQVSRIFLSVDSRVIGGFSGSNFRCGRRICGFPSDVARELVVWPSAIVDGEAIPHPT